MLQVELTHALRGPGLAVELEVAAGETVALAGASGAGKTTILRAIAGLVRPDAGRVRCGGATWLETQRRIDVPPEERGCGVVFQDYALFPHLHVWRNVAYGLRGMRRSARRTAAVALLDRFGAAGLAEARPGTLSGGERQRVALARALAPGPRVLLLDEPLSALDPTTRAGAARELAAALAAGGVPAIVVTHDFVEAATLGDRVAVLDGGRIVQDAPPAMLAAEPGSAFVADFTGASVLPGTARAAAGGLTEVVLAGGGRLLSTDRAAGAVHAVVRPWEAGLEAPGAAPPRDAASPRTRLRARVTAVTPLGNRVRVGLALPEPLTADVTLAAAGGLALAPGTEVVVVLKATATRLLARAGDGPGD
jgi:molybdate transport system ATP-binding protein